MEDPLTPCVDLAEFLLSRHTWYRPVLHLYCSQEYRDYKIANIFAKISQAFIFWQKAKCTFIENEENSHNNLDHFLLNLRYQFIYYSFFIYSPPRPRVFITLFIQYYSVICRPSDHTVGRPRAKIRTRDYLKAGTLPTGQPHLPFTVHIDLLL